MRNRSQTILIPRLRRVGRFVPPPLHGTVRGIYERAVNVEFSHPHGTLLASFVVDDEDFTECSFLVDPAVWTTFRSGVPVVGTEVTVDSPAVGTAVDATPTAAPAANTATTTTADAPRTTDALRTTDAATTPSARLVTAAEAPPDLHATIERCRELLRNEAAGGGSSAHGGSTAPGNPPDPGGFSALVDETDPAAPRDEDDPFLRRARATLHQALAQPAGSALKLGDLVGLGIGLTPSGDDFLSGALLGERTLTTPPYRPVVIDREAISDRLDRTTVAGRTLLFLALANEPPNYQRRLLGALRAGAAETAVAIARRHGASSGIDFLTGLIWFAGVAQVFSK